MAAAISGQCVSNAKWPVSKKQTSVPGMSHLNTSAPAGRKNGSFFPHTLEAIPCVANVCENAQSRQQVEQLATWWFTSHLSV